MLWRMNIRYNRMYKVFNWITRLSIGFVTTIDFNVKSLRVQL